MHAGGALVFIEAIKDLQGRHGPLIHFKKNKQLAPKGRVLHPC